MGLGTLIPTITPEEAVRRHLTTDTQDRVGELEAEVKMLKKALHRSNRDCKNMHHDKGEYHGYDELCPVEAWVNDALA